MVDTTILPSLRRTTLMKPRYLRLARMLTRAIPIIPRLPTLLLPVFHRITATATEGDDGGIIINSSTTTAAAAKGINLHQLMKTTF